MTAIDDEACLSLVRLFNEEEGKSYQVKKGICEDFIRNLPLLGISGIGNLLSTIKFARYFELKSNDHVMTVLTDSMELYGTRLEEMNRERGPYRETDAAGDFHRHLMGQTTDHMLELRYPDRKRIHNLKYFTWIEQQKKSLAELDAQWKDYPDFWERIHGQVEEIDRLIREFNEATGVLEEW